MEKGFVKIPRAVFGKDEIRDPVFTKAYVTLMFAARYAQTEIDGIRVMPGQLLISKSEFAKLLDLPLSRTRSILKRFEDMGGIRTENIKNKYTLITLQKYFLTGERDEISTPKKTRSVKKSAVSEDKSEDVICEPCGSKNDEIKEKTDISPEVQEISEVNENKTAYGKFRNVYLTLTEYEELKNLTPMWEILVDTLSARLVNSKGKVYDSHYALLINNYNVEKMRKPNFDERIKEKADYSYEKYGYRNKNEDLTPDPTASYDIMLAEEMARTTVPTVKKRPRR